MAKKTAKKAAPKKAAKKAAPKKAAKKKPASNGTATPMVSEEQIGYAAGAVWVALDAGKPLTIAAIKKAVDQPSDVTLMAIGWLAREGKLDFTVSGRSVKVELRR